MSNLKQFESKYHLVSEMLETSKIIETFDDACVIEVYKRLAGLKALAFTGEGSSRIFPALNAIFHAMQLLNNPFVITESSTDLYGKNLWGFGVVGASNSGRTKELVNLFKHLGELGHKNYYGVTCSESSKLSEHSTHTVIIPGGGEKAVAATKSVVSQALFFDLLLSEWTMVRPDLNTLAQDFNKTLCAQFNPSITDLMCDAENIYFAGYNNGVAEELTLKTNEIIRKRSTFLPGSYLLHGVEEVVSATDLIVLVDYMPEYAEKIKSVYIDNIGCKVIALSTQDTIFPTVKLECEDSFYDTYIKLAAGWKLLAEAGIAMNINLDKPVRARKVGNEV